MQNSLLLSIRVCLVLL